MFRFWVVNSLGTEVAAFLFRADAEAYIAAMWAFGGAGEYKVKEMVA